MAGFPVPFAAMVLAAVCWFSLGKMTLQTYGRLRLTTSLGLANVLLLQNTFRVLGPAINAARTSTSMRSRDMESFYAGDYLTFTKQQLRGSHNQAHRPNEKSQDSGNEGLLKSPSFQSGTSSERRLLASPQSFLKGDSRAGSMHSKANSLTIDRAITPVSELNRGIVVTPGSPVQRYSGNMLPITPGHSRQNSLNSWALPIPPRPTRSPMSQKPILENINVNVPHAQQRYSPIAPLQPAATSQSASYASHERPAHKPSASGASAQDLDISGWLSRQRPDGHMPRGVYASSTAATTMASHQPSAAYPSTIEPYKRSGAPLLSAVAGQSSFPVSAVYSPTISMYSTQSTGTGEPGQSFSSYVFEDAAAMGPPPAGRQRIVVQQPSMSAVGGGHHGRPWSNGSAGARSKLSLSSSPPEGYL